jgi:FlaA1/EpsC-like NDP-sugar epimerase
MSSNKLEFNIYSQFMIKFLNKIKTINLFNRFMPYRRIFIALFHIILFVIAYIFSFFLRFEGAIPEIYYQTMLTTLPFVVIVQGFFFAYHDLYQGLWRYVSFADVQNIIRATLLSMITILAINLLFSKYLGNIPRSVYVINCLLVLSFTCGSRFLVRHFRQTSFMSLSEIRDAQKVILVGPLEAAEPLLREMFTHGKDYFPMALIDPVLEHQGNRIFDVPILGGLQNISETANRVEAHEVIITWPDAPQDRLNEIIEHCKRSQLRIRTVPPLSEVLGGRYRLADVRDIELEDLLPRPPIYIDQENIQAFIKEKTVLVTGAGGSIGSELCRQVAKYDPAALIMVERAENSLYTNEVMLLRSFPDLQLHSLVASINDGPGMELLFQHYSPQLVFHAAAYKHVPLMERCPIEAAYNNILGTRNLVKAALASKVDHFIMISTDKAVNPTSVMGVTKRISEKYVQSLNGNITTKFITTRFGNVLGSAGSVIPLFKEQLAHGGPLTVTHPEIERFFMTISEAVQLVLQAAYMGQGGDIFVLNMGRSVKIRELAEKLIILAGKNPEKDIQIIYTGIRPGEKMFEELFNEKEQNQPTSHSLINRAIDNSFSPEVWEAHLDEIEAMVRKRDAINLLTKFKEIIPNYCPIANPQEGL